VRLQAFLARSGAAPSRRKAEALISSGRVAVNGEPVTIGATVNDEDQVLLDGTEVTLPTEHAYFALNKPSGYLTTLHDDRGRHTITELMPEVPGLVPAGRLDYETTGLLILTNDGKFAHHITHPSTEIEKEYLVTVRNPASQEAMAALSSGPELDDGPMLPPELSNLHRSPHETTFHLTIHEGRNRIIRRACSTVGLRVKFLKRLRIGSVEVGALPEGTYRSLTSAELEGLK
jgi:23S rRNA pseudouridine2605 synthase